MKIASFNINNINRRLSNLLAWLREGEPDVVCLQELKAADTEFPTEAIRQAGYHGVWRGERSWNGVAILARWAPVVTRMDLPGDDGDRQCRYLEAAVNGVLVASIYAPNGNPQPGPKFDYKLAWLERLTAHAGELYASAAPVVLAGDYNVVPTDLDIYPTKRPSKPSIFSIVCLMFSVFSTSHRRSPDALGNAPVDALDQHGELRRTERDGAFEPRHPGPHEAALIEPFGEEAQPFPSQKRILTICAFLPRKAKR
jgi:exodeoxyribonuclease III